MSQSKLSVLAVVTIAALFVGAPGLAHAERSKPDGALAWGILSTELTTAGVFAVNAYVEDWPLVLNFAPMVLGPAAGVAAHYAGLGPRPAYAIHGASMLGLDLFMVGVLVDGRNDRDGVRIGRTAWLLGALGAATGAWFGATNIDGGNEPSTFFGAPLGGFVAGGFVIGGIAALAANDSNKAVQRFVMGGVAGLTIGLVATAVYTSTDRGKASASSRRLIPRVTPDLSTVMLSYGGPF